MEGEVRLEYILKWREHPLNKPPRHSKGKTNSESVPRPEATYQSGIVHSTRPKGLVEWVPSLTTRATVVPFSLPMSEQERTLIHNNENLFRTSRQRWIQVQRRRGSLRACWFVSSKSNRYRWGDRILHDFRPLHPQRTGDLRSSLIRWPGIPWSLNMWSSASIRRRQIEQFAWNG